MDSISKDISVFLPNFRVLCEKTEEKDVDKRHVSLYRSSRPDYLSESEIEVFRKLGIKCIIDFRSKKEYAKADGAKLLDKFYPPHYVKCPHRRRYMPGEAVNSSPVKHSIEKTDDHMKPDGHDKDIPPDDIVSPIIDTLGLHTSSEDGDQTDANGSGNESDTELIINKDQGLQLISPSSEERPETIKHQGNCKHFLVNFYPGKYVWTVFKRAPWYIKLYSILFLLIDIILNTGYVYFVRIFAKYILNPRGVLSQYKDMIDLSNRSICSTLKLLSQPENLPAMINCAHGKDRTGIVSALVLSCLGKSREQIASNYAMSEERLKSIRERVYQEIVVRYDMDRAFAESKPETILQLLDYINETYGSVNNYFEYIGFSPPEQEQLKRNMTG